MNEITLPPSPNWYLSSILACASDGTIAWGARRSVVIAKAKDNSTPLDYKIIEKAHIERVTSIAFSPKDEENDTYRLVSGGDDNIIKVWNLKTLSEELNNTKLDNTHKVIAVDWSKHNPDLICGISEDGLLVTWTLNYNNSQLINLGKLTATCLACCPHDSNIVSVGAKSGLVYVVDIRGSGNIIYKLRGHDTEIVSLSWCPVPVNIFNSTDEKEFLLASGAKDRAIYLWKTGTDGRFQVQLAFPNAPLDSQFHRSKMSSGNYAALCWLNPTTLLSSSPWGELLLWDLTGSEKKKFIPQLVHGKHPRGLFSIVALSGDDFRNYKKPTEDLENCRTKINIKAIWTLAQDRQIIGCSFSNNELSIDRIISTQGGFVYCMSACPVDTSQIAFGVGDAMIRLWNLSEPYEKVELQMLWEKIKGKVRALSWHPEKENLLAFATNEGRVGVYDTNIKKPPILYRQHFRHIVYRVGWGPAPNVKEFALYACGDGESVYYNPEKPNDSPVSITKRKNCTEFCWKPDYTLLALGFGDGSIMLLHRDLTDFGHIIHTLNKAVQCLSWHPESTSSDLSVSYMQNYLAVGVTDTAITIFNISTKDDQKNESMFYKIVATLNSHGDKVVCLAWSPHMSGYLVSGSYDYTAQVWKVETEEVIATYTAHSGPLQCCMWSPFSQDLIITGAADFTLRIWSISKQTAVACPPIKTSTKGKRTKKKKNKEEMNGQNNVESGCKVELKEINGELIGDEKEIANQEQKSEESTDINKNVSKLGKKKKLRKVTHFPGYAEISNNNKLWCSSVRTLIDIVQNNSQYNETSTEKCNETVNVTNGEENTAKSNSELPIFLGNKTNLEHALQYEKKILLSSGNVNIAAEIDLWSNNLKEDLENAIENKQLNDFLVSLAPSVSQQMWVKVCKAYANQLIYEEIPHKAATYLLCINKVLEAIDVFVIAKLFKEAYALASSRLDPTDPIIQNILKQWAENALRVGHFQNASECFIKLQEFEKAAKTLERRKDMDSLLVAIDLANLAQDADLSSSLVEKAVAEALVSYDIPLAKSIIKSYPQIQHREVEIEVYSELNKALNDVNDLTIINWLKGLSKISLLETIGNLFTKCPEKYKLLLDSDVFPLPSSEKTIVIEVSHQLALSILSDQYKQIQHIVKAFDIIFHHEKTNPAYSENKTSHLISYVFALENKTLSDPNSIFNSNESEISKSLRAYLCYAIITWFLDSKLNEEQLLECIDLIIIVLQKCIEDLLDKQSIKFWTTKNEVVKVETQLSSTIGKTSENVEENIEDEIQKLIKRLEELKNERQHFIDNRISSPNPLFSYGAVMEFIGKISNEETRKKINDLVMDTWKKAIS